MSMTEDRLIELLDAYGADPMHWPKEERTDAQQALDNASPRVQAALREAQALDGLLMSAAMPSLSPAAIDMMTRQARPRLSQRVKALIGWQGPVWQPAGALAAALVLGISLGAANPSATPTLAEVIGTTTTTPAADEILDGLLIDAEDVL